MLTPEQIKKRREDLIQAQFYGDGGTRDERVNFELALCDMALAHLEAAPSGEGVTAFVADLQDLLDDDRAFEELDRRLQRGHFTASREMVDVIKGRITRAIAALAARPLEAAKQGEGCAECGRGPQSVIHQTVYYPQGHEFKAQPPASQGGEALLLERADHVIEEIALAVFPTRQGSFKRTAASRAHVLAEEYLANRRAALSPSVKEKP